MASWHLGKVVLLFHLNSTNKSSHRYMIVDDIFKPISVAIFAFTLSVHPYISNAKENEPLPAAVRWYQEMAAKGDVDAKYNLGVMNETGWSVPIDIEKAIRWYLDAASEGNADAQLRLGMIYYLGLGSSQSKIKGLSWIRKSAINGNKFAKQLTKELFNDDVSYSIDRISVLKQVRKVYLDNQGKAEVVLVKLIGNARKKSKRIEKSRDKTTIKERREARISSKENDFEVSAEKPSIKNKKAERIKNILPEFVGDKKPKGNRTVDERDVGSIRLQAEKGKASAQYRLGRMYELGIKLPVDRDKAFFWYQKAAAQNFADAEYHLAIAYLYGVNAEKSEELGMMWLSAAASNGHQVAKNLQEKLEASKGVLLPDQSIVVKWYLERAVTGDAESAVRLGKIFQYGWGVEPDLHEAIKWYKRASLLGAEKAIDLLQELDVGRVEKRPVDTSSQSGSNLRNDRSSNWALYLLAAAAVVGFFFWASILKRIKSASKGLVSMLHREEPHI